MASYAVPSTIDGATNPLRLELFEPAASARFGELLPDFAFQRAGVSRKIAVRLFQQEIVEAAAMLDRAQRGSGDAKAHRTRQRIRDQCDVAEVRQEARTRLAIGMADLVAGLNGLAGQFATA
jgi:hypothetical protein